MYIHENTKTELQKICWGGKEELGRLSAAQKRSLQQFLSQCLCQLPFINNVWEKKPP